VLRSAAVSVPAEIPGLGSSALKIRPNPSFDPMKAGIGPEEYFVLSRIDGALSLREVLLMTGLPMERAIETVLKLRGLGAILLPGETAITAPRTTAPTRAGTAPPATARAATAQPLPRAGAARAPTGPQPTQPAVGRTHTTARLRTPDLAAEPSPVPAIDFTLVAPTAEEQRALAESCEVSDEDRRRILAMTRHLGVAADAYILLGLTVGADRRQVKRAYFMLSKDFHPDRYFGKRLGSFGPRLDRIFETLSRAYSEVTEPRPREATRPQRQTGEAQSPTEYAAELFERACQTEVHGDPLEAMKLFAAAIRVDPQVRYLRRAARCALTAGQPRSAEEYANKAANLEPNDPSTARMLAAAFRAQNKLDAAEEVLIMALAVPSENDALVAELRKDLAEIRRSLKSG
jgi:hypothetical protein